MDLQTLFLGEPEYDNNGRIVGRKLGVQNMIAWLFIGLIGYQLMCRGGKKQKGGISGFSEFWEILTEVMPSAKRCLITLLAVLAVGGMVAGGYLLVSLATN